MFRIFNIIINAFGVGIKLLLVNHIQAAAIAWVYPSMRQELSPLEDRGVILANINAPDGATLDYTDRYARRLEAIGQQYPEFDRIFANIGNPSVSQGSVVYRAVDWSERQRSTLDIARQMQPQFNQLAGINAFPITPPSLGQGFRERPVNFVVQTSDSYDKLNRAMRALMDEVAKNPGFIAPDVDLRLSKPELRIEVDRERAADLGVSVDAVARAIETMLGGRQVTRYKRDAEQYDVIVQTTASGRGNGANALALLALHADFANRLQTLGNNRRIVIGLGANSPQGQHGSIGCQHFFNQVHAYTLIVAGHARDHGSRERASV